MFYRLAVGHEIAIFAISTRLFSYRDALSILKCRISVQATADRKRCEGAVLSKATRSSHYIVVSQILGHLQNIQLSVSSFRV